MLRPSDNAVGLVPAVFVADPVRALVVVASPLDTRLEQMIAADRPGERAIGLRESLLERRRRRRGGAWRRQPRVGLFFEV
jgi:hypothetical protein